MDHMKKILSFIMSFIMMSVIVVMPAAALEPTEENKQNIVSQYFEEIAEYAPQDDVETVALSFMRNSLKNENIEISNVTPFYDLNDNVTAYCVTIQLGNSPCGYVLISLLNIEMPIVEFAFEGTGPVNTVRSIQAARGYSSAPSTIRYFGPGTYFIDSTSADTISDVFTNETYSKSEVETAYTNYISSKANVLSDVVIGDGILDWADANIDSSSIVKIPSFGSGTDYWLMTDFNDGNVCSPTCATNILWYWGNQKGYTWCIENGDKTGYELAQGLFTAMSLQMATVPPLGTLDIFIRDAYTNFLSFRGSNFNTRVLSQNVYSDFTAAIDDNCPIHTMLRNESLFSTGHDVMTFGYGESNTGTEYLFVMDGWNNYGRFVYFDYFPIIKGVKVWVGSTAN